MVHVNASALLARAIRCDFWDRYERTKGDPRALTKLFRRWRRRFSRHGMICVWHSDERRNPSYFRCDTYEFRVVWPVGREPVEVYAPEIPLGIVRPEP
jgi:hypothetical protein